MLSMHHFYWHPQRPKTSADVFQVEQELWAVLAGHRASYWRNRGIEPRGPFSEGAPLYAPLEKEKKEIRLLQVTRLAPFDGNDTRFVAQLVQVTLQDNPTYVSISYTWGEQSVVGHFVDSNGVETTLGYSQVILDIVRTLVPPGGTLYLWIDAICINQEDHDERASQVMIMSDIYRQAQQVVIFLGMADDASTRAMDLLQLTRGFIQANGDVLPPLNIEEFEKRSLGAGLNPAYWAAFAQLLCRPWFIRCWTVQEVALASDAVVVCGHHAVRWDELCQLCRWVVDNNGLLFQVMERHLPVASRMAYLEAPFRNPPSIAVARDLQCAEKDPSILQQQVLYFCHFRTSDPRDKIFALLGLALPTDRVDHDLRPNYRIAVEDLYIQVARRILLRDTEILILAAAGVGHRRSLHLPSWVPDWTSLTEGKTLDEIAAAGNYHTTEHGTRPIVSYDPQFPKVLTIQGCIVDTISKLSSERLPLGREGRLRYVQDTAAWMEEVIRMTEPDEAPEIEQPQDSTRGQAQKMSLWKTLTASGPKSPQATGQKRG
ncbi:hypothetical protein FJTKL_15165 [Diaporthe vaccinii]|uniref:Heterokaryon incompatibility domain-containing protein n=1 Tax=Diaporthe vaccinii TaxID=105482 RepID=A0ABR4E670_9PEZI